MKPCTSWSNQLRKIFLTASQYAWLPSPLWKPSESRQEKQHLQLVKKIPCRNCSTRLSVMNYELWKQFTKKCMEIRTTVRICPHFHAFLIWNLALDNQTSQAKSFSQPINLPRCSALYESSESREEKQYLSLVKKFLAEIAAQDTDEPISDLCQFFNNFILFLYFSGSKRICLPTQGTRTATGVKVKE